MSATAHNEHLLQDYIDGLLAADEQRDVEQHLANCPSCREEFERLSSLIAGVQALPKSLEPESDLWAGIETKIHEQGLDHLAMALRKQRNGRPTHMPMLMKGSYSLGQKVAAAAAMVVLVSAGVFLWSQFARQTWTVMPLEGEPFAAETPLTKSRKLGEGALIETDATSRAYLSDERIGNVTAETNTRLEVLSTGSSDHRLALLQGRIHARIWAPPRLFFVQTPSGLAIDLGCEYTLDVDSSGSALLHVLSGFVSFERKGSEVIVPAGWLLRGHPSQPPGTPYSETASPTLQAALKRFDFGGKSSEDLALVLSEARAEDAITLWEWVEYRVKGNRREQVYDRLIELVPPPPGVTRAGVFAGNLDMVYAWRKKLGVDLAYWWKYKKKKRNPGS